MLCECPHDHDCKMVDAFSIINMMPCQKELCFPHTCKRSDKQSRSRLKSDLQLQSERNGNRLVSNGSGADNKQLVLNCVRCRVTPASHASKECSIYASSKPCFHDNIQVKPFVRKKQAENRKERENAALSSNQNTELIQHVKNAQRKSAMPGSQFASMISMTTLSWLVDSVKSNTLGTPN